MAVYVDSGRNPYGRMKMCHMLADSLSELHDMARRLGLKPEWFQEESTPHYDLCQAKRKEAVKLGAVEADRKKVVELVRRWRAVKEPCANPRCAHQNGWHRHGVGACLECGCLEYKKDQLCP